MRIPINRSVAGFIPKPIRERYVRFKYVDQLFNGGKDENATMQFSFHGFDRRSAKARMHNEQPTDPAAAANANHVLRNLADPEIGRVELCFDEVKITIQLNHPIYLFDDTYALISI